MTQSSEDSASGSGGVPPIELGLLDDIYCQGVYFTIQDENTLAHSVALVLVQEYVLAKGIMSGVTSANNNKKIVLDNDEIEDIVARRLNPSDDYHRDGFLFQLMMWLAAHLDLEEGDLVALPHTQAAAKGQDSVIVHCSDEAVVALSICEDKATERPRDTVRDDVWPEIREYEAGGRRDELRSNVIATLGLGGVSEEDAIALVRRISWDGSRKYRVRVTLERERTKGLFKGFPEVVQGNKRCRRGETTQIPQLRHWMTKFARRVEARLRDYSKGP